MKISGIKIHCFISLLVFQISPISNDIDHTNIIYKTWVGADTAQVIMCARSSVFSKARFRSSQSI